MIKAILFDLDGTLLPMDNDEFVKGYFALLAEKFKTYGYDTDKLMKGIFAGISAMISNNGSKSNEEAFWESIASVSGKRCIEDKPLFLSFYENEFQSARAYCGYEPKARQIVELAKNKGLKIVLATNPLFPAVATQSRIKWAGLIPQDFEIYTTYENSRYCKPNPLYYREILRDIGLKPDECLMVGNDVDDDMPASDIGMKVFLLTNCLINRSGKDINVYPHGDFDDLENYISKL